MTFDFEAERAVIAAQLAEFEQAGQRCFLSTSFQSNSVVLLHLISEIDPNIPIYFINTGYHFPETLKFRDELMRRFSLRLIELRSDVPKCSQISRNGRLLFVERPNYCCYLNKVLPLIPIKSEYDVWISGLRRGQSSHRANLLKVGVEDSGKTKYLPILDWTQEMVDAYVAQYELPFHPLHEQGYLSVGCEPCTRPVMNSGQDSRSGRWQGLTKTECGLHL
ncbi:phosphoadenylyl-sulfate reductase [Opitutales bacterium]|nr:phosphoadenylyl-sulfate reductase [Opitutales bacterium]MDB2681514.1 phosphoadenylyl-sulfate reductase [Opitutales bacterium]